MQEAGGDAAYDSSRPTSPSDSVNLASPMFGPSKHMDAVPGQEDIIRHRRRKSQGLKPPTLATIRSVSSPISLTTKSSPATAVISAISPANSSSTDLFPLPAGLHSTIPEENEDDSGASLEPAPEAEIDTTGQPSPEDEQCSNCHQWIPKRTMVLHENFCRRNNISCPDCGDVFQKDSEEWKAH